MRKNILPSTTERVSAHTNPKANDAIRSETIERLNIYKDSNEKIFSDRIQKLNAEWDTERVLETNASIIVLVSLILGFKSNKHWFLLTGAVGFFLLQHALQGWCPPVPFIREMGIRTAEEIYKEKTILKMMRGDFSQNTSEITDMLVFAEKK